jgi:hypothetical protein
VQDLGIDGRPSGEIRTRVLREGGTLVLRKGWRGGGERDGQRRKAVRHRATAELFL